MIPQLSVAQIPCSSINITDVIYNLRPVDVIPLDQQLKESIQQTGILHLPLLQAAHKNQYIILSGRKRILTAQSLGIEKLSCFLLPQEINPALKWKIILTHALIGSRLSCIEQAIFFSKSMKELSVSDQLLLLPLIGRKPQPYVLQELTGYLTLAPETIKAMHVGFLQEKTAKKLVKLSFKDQQTIVELIRYYRFGGTKQKKFVAAALDLIMRTGHSFKKILEGWNQHSTESENRPQQAVDLLSWLDTQCLPKSTRAREQFIEFQRQQQLPGSCTLCPSLSFEDNSLTLSIVFKSHDEFLQRWPLLKNIMTIDHE